MSKQRSFFIRTAGSHQFPRFRLFDCGQGYWSNEGWTWEEQKASLYWSWEHAASAMREVKLKENADKPRRRFRATVTLDVLGDRPLTREKLIDHLAEKTRLLQSGQPRGALIFLQIDWNTLKPCDGERRPEDRDDE